MVLLTDNLAVPQHAYAQRRVRAQWPAQPEWQPKQQASRVAQPSIPSMKPSWSDRLGVSKRDPIGVKLGQYGDAQIQSANVALHVVQSGSAASLLLKQRQSSAGSAATMAKVRPPSSRSPSPGLLGAYSRASSSGGVGVGGGLQRGCGMRHPTTVGIATMLPSGRCSSAYTSAASTSMSASASASACASAASATRTATRRSPAPSPTTPRTATSPPPPSVVALRPVDSALAIAPSAAAVAAAGEATAASADTVNDGMGCGHHSAGEHGWDATAAATTSTVIVVAPADAAHHAPDDGAGAGEPSPPNGRTELVVETGPNLSVRIEARSPQRHGLDPPPPQTEVLAGASAPVSAAAPAVAPTLAAPAAARVAAAAASSITTPSTTRTPCGVPTLSGAGLAGGEPLSPPLRPASRHQSGARSFSPFAVGGRGSAGRLAVGELPSFSNFAARQVDWNRQPLPRSHPANDRRRVRGEQSAVEVSLSQYERSPSIGSLESDLHAVGRLLSTAARTRSPSPHTAPSPVPPPAAAAPPGAAPSSEDGAAAGKAPAPPTAAHGRRQIMWSDGGAAQTAAPAAAARAPLRRQKTSMDVARPSVRGGEEAAAGGNGSACGGGDGGSAGGGTAASPMAALQRANTAPSFVLPSPPRLSPGRLVPSDEDLFQMSRGERKEETRRRAAATLDVIAHRARAPKHENTRHGGELPG